MSISGPQHLRDAGGEQEDQRKLRPLNGLKCFPRLDCELGLEAVRGECQSTHADVTRERCAESKHDREPEQQYRVGF